MYCANCGERLIETATRCPSCGTEVRQAPPALDNWTSQEIAAATQPSQDEQGWPAAPDTYPRGLSDQAKKLILVGLAAIVVVFLIFKFTSGVGGGSHSTPEKAVKGYFNAVKGKNFKGMYSYLTVSVMDPKELPEGVDKDSILKDIENLFAKDTNKYLEIKIKDVKINNSSASVNFGVVFVNEEGKSTEENSMDVKLINGKWYVDNRWY
ncbi:zinc-ribbon domain-containing protein [Cohnella abietis]|uniref:Zinc-ribbon domain-containing protein n=1 Tax=Cohnella abietis TaxID=2507935 RepID=A0A3T1D014_9BACL|nr:zinc ribbon domain-containing protein [Cohnella abietis]BBI31440.1 hypothetical protein KCTCHS21_08390 [Cohnella abietis]